MNRNLTELGMILRGSLEIWLGMELGLRKKLG
jgi:hypothetical protein